MSNAKSKIKERHFVTLTRIVYTQTNQTVFPYCTVLTIVVSTCLLQQLSIWRPLSSLHNLYLRIMFLYTYHITSGVCWISCAAPNTRVIRFSIVSTWVWYSKNFTWPHRKKSSGIKSSDCGGHAIGPPQSIYICPKHWLRWSRTVPAKLRWSAIVLKTEASTDVQWHIFQQLDQ